jgi:hypothetical protein
VSEINYLRTKVLTLATVNPWSSWCPTDVERQDIYASCDSSSTHYSYTIFDPFGQVHSARSFAWRSEILPRSSWFKEVLCVVLFLEKSLLSRHKLRIFVAEDNQACSHILASAGLELAKRARRFLHASQSLLFMVDVRSEDQFSHSARSHMVYGRD